ncbi:hypothetical protein BKK54_11370 [Rodentibacter genomosp. 1]|uniref:Uncharacterized protein n=2 Tax=Rodentibacter genomosp. 1 TaxID=1908264 RepID=A0A1V3IZH4_9PAST|nr:hypothetical protein BKK54_11370 [Rodentibacter genomosp. 1]
MAIRAVTAALQAVAQNDTNGAIVALASPYLNQKIHEMTDGDTAKDKATNLIAHALLSAVEFQVTGKDPLTGAIAGVTGEATAEIIAQKLYEKSPKELTASEKENISTLSQLAGGLAGALTAKANSTTEQQGGNFLTATAGADTAKRAVENNYLSHQEAERKRYLEAKLKEGTITNAEQQELHSIQRKDIESDIALISACEGAALSSGCQVERQKLERDKFSYSGAKYTPTYGYPSYTKYSDLYSEDYGKVADFSGRYDVLSNAKEKAHRDFKEATGINPRWAIIGETAGKVLGAYAGVNIAKNVNNFSIKVPDGVDSTKHLPIIGKTVNYEDATANIRLDSYSINAQVALNKKLSALENAQKFSVRIRHLADGRIRYYEAERLAKTPGPTRGNSFVTEYNPFTGSVKQWMESYDHSGNVNRVHPKSINGQVIDSLHYPPTKKELEGMNKR